MVQDMETKVEVINLRVDITAVVHQAEIGETNLTKDGTGWDLEDQETVVGAVNQVMEIAQVIIGAAVAMKGAAEAAIQEMQMINI